MKKGQIRMDDGSEFTVYFLKNKNKPHFMIPNPFQCDTFKDRMEKEEKSLLMQWFWGKIKNYE